MEREQYVEGLSRALGNAGDELPGEDGSRMIGRASEYSRMSYRADGALVPGNPGIVGVNVNCLDKAGEGDQQHA